jgi:hypothetical protein
MADPLSVIAGITGVSIACAQLASVVYIAYDRTRYTPASTRETASSMSLLYHPLHHHHHHLIVLVMVLFLRRRLEL